MISTVLGLGLPLAAQAGVVQGSADLESAYQAQRVAVLVGVQDYGDPALQGLRFPAKDAHDLAGVLQDPSLGGFDRVVVVEGGAQTTAQKVRDVIAVATADLQRDDTFLLYLSGHGTLTLDPREGSRLWFLPSDGVLDDPEGTGIAIADLEEMVGDLSSPPAGVDAGHPPQRPEPRLSAVRTRAGQQADRPAPRGLAGEPPAPEPPAGLRERGAPLRCPVPPARHGRSQPPERGLHAHIIQALTRASSAADLDGDGLVDVTEAHDYARDHTMRHQGTADPPCRVPLRGARRDLPLGRPIEALARGEGPSERVR